MFLKVFALLELRLFNSCSTSDEEITFRENVDAETVSLIFKMLGCTLYFFSAISIGLSGGGKVDSAFHPSEVGEMSSSVINAAQVCYGCADRRR